MDLDTKVKKLCVFQGTFNPIHNAHLRVANYVLENYSFDRVIFIPAYNPPHKNCDLNLSQHRLNMVKLATEDNNKFETSDIEYKRQGKSYTYLTIKELYEKYPNIDKIHFIIGTDAFEHIESWYETDKLKTLIKFIVFIREDNFEKSKYDYLREKGYDFELQNLPYKKISSTDLRLNFNNNKDNLIEVPQKVMEYIKKHELYQN